MVDLHEVVELSRRQLGLSREKPPVARLLAQPLEAGGEKRLVLGRDRAQRHPRAVAQSDRFAPRRSRHRLLSDKRTHAKLARPMTPSDDPKRPRTTSVPP